MLSDDLRCINRMILVISINGLHHETSSKDLGVTCISCLRVCLLPKYACDVEAEVVGKPSPMFFQSVLADMGIQPSQVGVT